MKMKLSISAFRAQASAQRKILSSHQNQLNYGACTSFPAFGGFSSKEKSQMMVDSTGQHLDSPAKSNERSQCSGTSVTVQKQPENLFIMEPKDEKEKEVTDVLTNPRKRVEILNLEKTPGRIQSKSNQRWMKLRTTVQLSGAISSTNPKSKPPIKREDSFLKRFSTRQTPETQETVDTGDETETVNGSHTQNEINRRRRKRRKEMSKTVVNPDENFYFYWLMTVTFCVLYNLWTLIVRQSFPELQKAASVFWYSSDGFTDVIFICDIIVQFRTGYLEQGLMVCNSKKLASHYLKSRAFTLDVLSLLPLDFLQINIGVNPMVRFPRFLKIYRVYNYYYMVESRTVYPNLWRVVNLIHILLILAHWFGCFYYLLSEAEGFQGNWVYPYRPGEYATLTRKYLGSLYWSTLTLTTIGDLPTPETNAEFRGRSKAMTALGQSEDIPRRGHKSRLLQFNSNYGYLFTIISYLIGVFIFATIVGQVGNVITNRNANRLEFERLLDGAKTYMRHHKVPGGMKRRVLRWYDYSWSRGRIQGGGDINTALGLLPDKLKTELALHVNLSVLKKVTIFQECQPEFLHDLVLKMKAYIFTPGDLICRKGEVAREMFIIADGILDVIGETGRVLTTMKAGDFFGEIGILNLDGLNKRTADVRSVGYSELFSLSREDVLSAMKDYPEAQEILQTLGRKRLMEAKNVSKIHKAQAKQTRTHDSSGDSDAAGKKIVEKLRSDVKGLKNVLRRSKRGTRKKEASEIFVKNSGEKTSNKKHSILRRMSHVQSSDEYDTNNDVDETLIGAGLPLLQRLKLLKERQEKERNKSGFWNGNQTKNNENTDLETFRIGGLPFTKKFKSLKQKEVKDFTTSGSSVISSVRTQVSGLRFDKSAFEVKKIISPRLIEEKVVERNADEENIVSNLKKKKSTEIGRILLKEGFKLTHASQLNDEISPSMIIVQKADNFPNSNSSFKAKSETSVNMSLTKKDENSMPKSLDNNLEVPKTKDGWKLLKKSSISCSKPIRKLGGEENKLIRKVSRKDTYLSKSDTVLEKHKTLERKEEKRSRSISPSNNSTFHKNTVNLTVDKLIRERKKSSSMCHSLKIEENRKDIDYREFPDFVKDSRLVVPEDRSGYKNKEKMKKYNSIGDLSPEYSGLSFVKRLKILNERQKLEELEKELLVRSVSLDAPESSMTKCDSVLVRSRSEASSNEFRNINGSNFPAELVTKWQNEKSFITCDKWFWPSLEPYLEFREITYDGENHGNQIYLEETIISPENNETLERRHLKSILKKLSAEDNTNEKNQAPENLNKFSDLKKRENTELKQLMRAPTMEGYAARHKKLTKSVTFDSDTMPSSPDTFVEQPSDESKAKGFSLMSPTAILTLQLSNLSMIPIAGPKKMEKKENAEKNEEKNIENERIGLETTFTKMLVEKHKLKLEKGKQNILQKVVEENVRMLPFVKNLGDEFFAEMTEQISQVLQQLLEKIHNKFQMQYKNLQAEIKKKDEIIVQLQSKVQKLKINNDTEVKNKSRIELVEQNVDPKGIDSNISDAFFLKRDCFETIHGYERQTSPTESLSLLMPPKALPSKTKNSFKTEENELAIPSQDSDFYFDRRPSDYLGNIINCEKENLFQAKDEFGLLPEQTETAETLFKRNLKRSTEQLSDLEIEIFEQPKLHNLKNFKKRKTEFFLKSNLCMNETQLEETSESEKVKGETEIPNDAKKAITAQSKGSFIGRVTQLQHSFKCSPEKSPEFVTLDIDDSSNSSDIESLRNKDWEVQMLVEELVKKDPDWQIKEDKCSLEKKTNVEHLDEVKKLQKEVSTLRRMVCDCDLTQLTGSELDILETIIETKDQKIAQIDKTRSLNYDDKEQRQKRQMQLCPSYSGNKLNRSEQKKKPSLRQKIGQALSFDLHDIKSGKFKSPDHIRDKAFCLKKQKTISHSPKHHQKWYSLWHTSDLLRNRVFEDSDLVIKNVAIGSSAKASSRSSLPILISNSLPPEEIREARTSLPVLSTKDLRSIFTERLASSISSSEETHQESDFKQSCDSVFEETVMSWESAEEEKHNYSSPSTNGLVSPKVYQHSNSLNSFIKSVGQKVKQVMTGDANIIRNPVPTISKLCDDQSMVKSGSASRSEDLGVASVLLSEENLMAEDNELFSISESFDPKSISDSG